MMNITTEKYNDSIDRLPTNGKHILAHQSESSLIVYQAFRPSIAAYAIDNQKFGGPNYSLNRMTWIKPNFLWMMYRSGWASKKGQERILAISIAKSAFDEMLDNAVVSSFHPEHYSTREDWKNAIAKSEIRLQWDPDHDPFGNKLDRRAIQLGLRGNSLIQFVDQQTERIEDITNFVVKQRQFVMDNKLEELEIPYEELYVPSEERIIEKIKID